MNTQILKRRFEKVQSSEHISILFFELRMITSDFFNEKLEDNDTYQYSWFLMIEEVRRRGFSNDEIQQYLDNLLKFSLLTRDEMKEMKRSVS